VFITDIDGTLLNSEHKISKENLASIELLRKKNKKIVLATGRNFFSVKKAIPQHLPIDYLIFSTGLGIYDWKKQKFLYTKELEKSTIDTISKHLQKNDVAFFAQNSLPQNHYFYFWENSNVPDDFYRRKQHYEEFSLGNINSIHQESKVSQFIAVLKNDNEIAQLKNGLDVQYIRSTSPLDHQSVWLEIFPQNTSKGHALEWLCSYLHEDKSQCLSIGNDYNDMEMLNFTGYSFCVDNAPQELKSKFKTMPSNNDNGVTKAINYYLKNIKE